MTDHDGPPENRGGQIRLTLALWGDNPGACVTRLCIAARATLTRDVLKTGGVHGNKSKVFEVVDGSGTRGRSVFESVALGATEVLNVGEVFECVDGVGRQA